MAQSKTGLKKDFQAREMPPKGLNFTLWEQDKKDFIAYYGHLVAEDKHPVLIQMLSDLKECRMARLAEQREDDELSPEEPRYFSNERDLDELLEDYARQAETGAFDMNLNGAFSPASKDSVEALNFQLLLHYYEQETVAKRRLRRDLVEPISHEEIIKLGLR